MTAPSFRRPPSSSEDIHYLTFLRHGESRANQEGVLQGQSDSPLSTNGRSQAEALAKRWASENKRFHKIIASPLSRAKETAEIVAAALSVPITLDPLWMERDYGNYVGLSRTEIQASNLQPAFVHPYFPAGETGESAFDLYLRAGKALTSLLRRPPNRYLIVSHGGILNMVMYAILGLPPQANFTGPKFAFGNTTFATLTYNPGNHTWRVLGLNDGSHLSD
jgi:broad specificity phosphatase PhoE